MIARRWRVWTDEARADALADYLGRTGVGAALATPGCVGALLLRSDQASDEIEFTLITFWESLDAARTFAGDTHQRAVLYPEDRGYFTRFDEIVEHLHVAAHDGLL